MLRIFRYRKFVLALIVLVAAIDGLSQTPEETPKKVNFRYSQNPKSKAKKEEKKPESTAETELVKSESVSVEQKTQTEVPKTEVNTNAIEVPATKAEFEPGSIASKTMEIAKRSSKAAASPTEIYKVGAGDVLFISLQNAPSGSATYFTVLNDGTIDYPLASGTVAVQGLTTDEIEELLEVSIKLVESPKVAVRVREHASHSINVIGLVEKPGSKLLQREAVPLFVVRAEAIVKSNANRVIIRRANSVTETFDLDIESYDSVLIFPGDIVEFTSVPQPVATVSTPPFYYIGGNVRTIGQKDFYAGITLSQAILASGGLKKGKDSVVVVRRKNLEGLLESMTFDLNEIKNGKIPDPKLEAGDTIEVGS